MQIKNRVNIQVQIIFIFNGHFKCTFSLIADSRYWIGFVKEADSDKWTKLDLTTSLTYHAPIIEESDDVLYLF